MVADRPGQPSRLRWPRSRPTHRLTPAWSPRLLGRAPRRLARGGAPSSVAAHAAAGAYSLGLHGRAHPVRRPRPAGHPAAGARAGSTAAGSWPARPRPWTSSGPASSARSSPARWSPSTSDGLRSRTFAAAEPQGLPLRVRLPGPPRHHASPGRNVHATRVEVGRRLAPEHPGRGRPGHPGARVRHARGHRLRRGAAASPTAQGLVKNSYVGPDLHPAQPDHPPARHPAQAEPAARGGRAASGWSWWTTRSCAATPSGPSCRMLREAGAAEVHVRISSPPVSWPCFYGIDFATRAELIAAAQSVEEICASIGADSLGYISLDGLIAATTIPAGQLCRACFDGEYPIPVDEAERRQVPAGEARPLTSRWPGAPATGRARRRRRAGPPVSQNGLSLRGRRGRHRGGRPGRRADEGLGRRARPGPR